MTEHAHDHTHVQGPSHTHSHGSAERRPPSSRAPAERHPPSAPIAPLSLLRLSLAGRLAVAGAGAASLWLAVLWVL